MASAGAPATFAKSFITYAIARAMGMLSTRPLVMPLPTCAMPLASAPITPVFSNAPTMMNSPIKNSRLSISILVAV